MTTGIMYSIIFFQFPMRIISGRSNFLKAIFHSASLNIQKITQQCVRLFYSLPYPPCFFMGGCELGWKIRRVLFRLIRIAETVAEWRFTNLCYISLGVWGWLTLLPCASTTSATDVFQRHLWRSLIWKILRHTHLYIYEYRLGVPKLYLQTHIFDIEVRVRLTKLNGWL